MAERLTVETSKGCGERASGAGELDPPERWATGSEPLASSAGTIRAPQRLQKRASSTLAAPHCWQ